ncbi:MAG: hypothetical protein AAF745_14295, partial [Planctomycetota bacterium]
STSVRKRRGHAKSVMSESVKAFDFEASEYIGSTQFGQFRFRDALSSAVAMVIPGKLAIPRLPPSPQL